MSLILLLLVLNALLALSEMAVVSSRQARLQQYRDEERPGAATALALHQDPGRFLSTIQVGITGVGVLSGAIGEAAIADPLALWIARWPSLAPYAASLALAVAVVLITYLTVVLGELVPKRLALLAPERIAMTIARPMTTLAALARPLVWLLARSSDAVLALLPRRVGREPPVTDEEIAVLMEQGAEAGVFHESEQALVSNVLRLDERRVTGIMTPRQHFFLVDLDDGPAAIHDRLTHATHNHIVVCRGGTDNVLGIVRTTDLLADALAGRELDLERHLTVPLQVPETATTTSLIETFREEGSQFALVTDEYGEVQGLVTDSDFLGAIVGSIVASGSRMPPGIRPERPGVWLVDGAVAVEALQDTLEVDELPGRGAFEYSTAAGFVLQQFGRLPVESDAFDWEGYRFEVLDMDGRRVDKIRVTRLDQTGSAPG